MTSLAQQEHIIVGDVQYEIGEPISPTPEAVMSLESLEQLVLSRRVQQDGTPAMMPEKVSGYAYPTRPTDKAIEADPNLLNTYGAACRDYAEEIKAARPMVPIPPAIGVVRVTDNPNYFQLRQESGTVSVMNYADRGQALYHLHLAEIVE